MSTSSHHTAEHELIVNGKTYTVQIRAPYVNDQGRLIPEKTSIFVHRFFPTCSAGYGHIRSLVSVRNDTKTGLSVLAKLDAILKREVCEV
jgi:hypothetical protein